MNPARLARPETGARNIWNVPGPSQLAAEAPFGYFGSMEPANPCLDSGLTKINPLRPDGTGPSLRSHLVPILIGSLIAGCLFEAKAAEANLLASPDGRIQVSIQMPVPGSTERPRWSASFRTKLILSECKLGLQTAGTGDLFVGARVLREQRRAVDERIPVLFGKADHAQDRFREIRYIFQTSQPRRVDVVFRCYDDAIALRYELPATETATSVTITNETTSFRLEGEPTAFVQYLENYNTSHEHNVLSTAYRDIRTGTLLDLPLTFSWPDNSYAAITEGSLRHYAGMSLLRPPGGDARDELVCELTPRPDGTKVVRPLPLETPWRVVLIADRPGALLESETLYCLNQPSVIKDVSWIKPGKKIAPRRGLLAHYERRLARYRQLLDGLQQWAPTVQKVEA